MRLYSEKKRRPALQSGAFRNLMMKTAETRLRPLPWREPQPRERQPEQAQRPARQGQEQEPEQQPQGRQPEWQRLHW